ncbi:MAG: phosphoribosylamine--glycine ligase [Alphaproteobacteria bacterium]|nr:phosphoribosylamine--glycine ligase [Alphaproteobacteria bacterium]
MDVLLIGSGGREHALAWRLAASEFCEALYCAPGNAGVAECAEIVPIALEDIDGLTRFAAEKNVDLVVVGPEAPLVAGVADRMREKGIAVFGPSASAARLEGSKSFTKELCTKYNIPTARYGRFTDAAAARKYIEDADFRMVVKADGLAAGKGVIIPESREEAIAAAEDMLSGSFGEAGASVVVEEFLDGEEVSYFALADGDFVLPLSSAQDHKRAYDGDKGPNTGGMGAYSPARPGIFPPELEREVMETIILPTVRGMKEEGCPFTGVLYAGLMIVDGKPYLIEYNCRFGDPECQPLMMRMQGDLLEVLLAAAQGRLRDVEGKVSWSDEAALCVVMAANGYPGAYAKGTPIGDLSAADSVPGVKIFHAGTALGPDRGLVSNGGRVLGVTARAETVEQAQKQAYEAVDKIDWQDGFCRRDIGWRAS